MMARVGTIAINTFREGIRARILYNLLFFATALIIFSFFLGQLSIGENLKVMTDLGLFSISVFGILIGVFVGIGIVYKEIEKRTIYTIISKPIKRQEFIAGKYCGLCLILLVQLILMWALFAATLYMYSGSLHLFVWPAIVAFYCEFMVITAIAIFFSSFSSPFLSALFTMSSYFIGHSVVQLHEVAIKTGNAILIAISTVFSKLNLDYFNLTTEVVHGLPLTSERMVNTIVYGFSISTLILLISFFIFSRRDFK